VTRIPLLALLCAAALALAACGEREDPEPAAGGVERLSIILDYFPNADHAGLYAAEATGAFADAKLEVKPRTPSDPAAPLKLLAAGKVDLAISYEPEVLLARDRGLKVVSIGAIVQRPLTSLMSLGKKPIRRPEQLAGKLVGTAGIPYQSAYLKAIAAKAGLDEGAVREVNVGFNLTQSMLARRVDATLGSFWNYEGVDLERKGRKPTILRMENLGVPTYNELVVVAREQDAGERGGVLRRFMQALARGHEALRKDPSSGVDPLLEVNPDLERGLQTAVVKATLPVFFPDDEARPWGWQDTKAWQRYGAWMAQQGLLKRPEDPARALTNEFLPGEGLEVEDGPAAP
jgi:putative hydroxymethylpyrimidine transport system substrate-binding protein